MQPNLQLREYKGNDLNLLYARQVIGRKVVGEPLSPGYSQSNRGYGRLENHLEIVKGRPAAIIDGWGLCYIDSIQKLTRQFGEQHDISIKEMLTGDVNRLRYVTRFSTSLVLHRENVAEHSYYVALYGMFLVYWVQENVDLFDYNGSSRPICELEVLKRCLLHDVDESRTGDFQRPFKYSNKDLLTQIEAAAKWEFTEAVQPIFPDNDSYIKTLVNRWVWAKDDSREGAIVALADYMSVISYLLGEAGNSNFSIVRNYRSLLEYKKKFETNRFDFLRPVVLQVFEMFDELLDQAGIKLSQLETK